MGNFNRDRQDRYKRDFRGGGFGGRKQDRQMHKTTCSECGNTCEVPFNPTQDKPVYCSDCFEKRGGPQANRFQDRNFRQGGFSDKKMFSAICDSCGEKCEVPFRPTSGKPIYCHNCFKKGSSSASQNIDQSKQEFDKINAKLDQILKALTPAPKVKTEIKENKTPKIRKIAKK